MLLGFYGDASVEHEIDHQFTGASHVPENFIKETRRAKRIPLVTIEPFTLPNLVNGLWVQYLKNTKLDSFLYIRYGHEFNIPNHYPWSNWGPKKFVREFRSLANAFRAANPMVRMVWCPNVKYHGSTPIKNWYPGNEYVDVIGIDGYNGTQPDGLWRFAPEIFDAGFQEIAQIKAMGKPWWICETASRPARPSESQDRDVWLGSLVSVARQWAVDAIIYFNDDKEQNWRLTGDEQRHLRTLVSGGYPAKINRVPKAPEEEQEEVDPRTPTPQLPPNTRRSTFDWLERITGRRWG